MAVVRVALVVASVALGLPETLPTAAGQTTERINLSYNGGQSCGLGWEYLVSSSLSSDGRFVAFESGAADLTCPQS